MDLVLTREFAWSRFQEQSELNGCKPCEFQMAIEEALLAENGFTEKLLADINIAAGNTACDESIQLRGIQEATGSNQDPDYHYAKQASYCFLLFILVYLHRVA
jgi:hypothetical protein